MDDQSGQRFQLVASRAVELLEDLIGSMESAADIVARGEDLSRICTTRHELYLVPASEGRDEGIACIMSAESCFDLLETAASGCGVDLEETEELVVKPPDMEFDEGLITGGFMAWKGMSVEISNDPLEEMLERMVDMLSSRGLSTSFDESSDVAEVIFFLPIKRTRRRNMRG